MTLLSCTRQRLKSFIAEIDRLSDSEFPYAHSNSALLELRQFFSGRLVSLESLDEGIDPTVIRTTCSLILLDFFVYLPLLGFILRSTNVRNAFETFRPLLRLARQVLEPTVPEPQRSTKLLISSEWDYSPLTYTTILQLPGYVFLGFPAPESGNPLLVSLAGHELGHAVWKRERLAERYMPGVIDQIVKIIQGRWIEFVEIFHPDCKPEDLGTDLFATESWAPAAAWCIKQAEESFCDYLGLALFRESFLHAFAYLLSPSLGPGHRTVYYPPLRLRAERLAAAATVARIAVPGNYVELFGVDTTPTLSRGDEFRVLVADEAVKVLLPALRVEADEIFKRSGLSMPTSDEETRILQRFRQAVPMERCSSVAALLNSAWKVQLDPKFWPESTVPANRREEVLRELVLKNFEVMEIERIQAER